MFTGMGDLPFPIKGTKLDETWLKGARGPGCTNVLFTCRVMVRRITPSELGPWLEGINHWTLGHKSASLTTITDRMWSFGHICAGVSSIRLCNCSQNRNWQKFGLRQSLTTGGTKHTACQPQVTITVWPSPWRVICHAQSKLNIVLVATMEWIQYRGLTYNGHIIQQFYCLVRMPLYIDNRDYSSQKRQSKTQYLDLYIFN